MYLYIIYKFNIPPEITELFSKANLYNHIFATLFSLQACKYIKYLFIWISYNDMYYIKYLLQTKGINKY